MKITRLVPIEVEVPDGTPPESVKITSSSGFMADVPMAAQPDTGKLYGDSSEALAAAEAGNEAEHALKFRTIRDQASDHIPGTSYRVWPINEQAGFAIPSGWFAHKTPTKQPTPPKQVFEPAAPGTHDPKPDDASLTGVRPGGQGQQS